MSLTPTPKRNRYWIGIDIGGTFTDFVVYDSEKLDIFVYKTPTAASKRGDHVLAGLAAVMARYGLAGKDVAFLGHGTTVATNAVLTREAPPLGLLTTRGFGDVLAIRRQTRPETFDYYADFPPALVPRDRIVEVGERLGAAGEVIDALDPREFVNALKDLTSKGVVTVAIAFLHSYANPVHERQARAIAQEEYPDLLVSLSSDLVPEFREYERTSTTVLNAFVRPPVISYVTTFEAGLRKLGIGAPLLVMQGNGGIMSSETAKRQPVSLIRSGPAAGVAGAAFVAGLAGERRIITCDIGGTSTDVSVFAGESPSLVRDWDVHTFPVKWTALDIRSIGAGGGSVAWLDSGGLLKVGPRSAGAEPGPGCYERGGTEATVTDAHLLLGRIGPDAVLGDSLKLSHERAEEVLTSLGRQLDRTARAAAAGIVEIVNAAIAQEIHYICTEKGCSARDYTLVAYGGAGPLHAAEVARELNIRKVLIPSRPGLVCALGVLASVPRADFAVTRLLTLREAEPSSLEAIRDLCEQLNARAQSWVSEQDIPFKGIHKRWTLDMRYRGQNYELPVEIAEDRLGAAGLIEQFHRRHEQTYGYRSTTAPVQCVNVRLTMTLDVDRPPLRARPPAEGPLTARGERAVYLGREDGFTPCPVYLRDQIPARSVFQGPAVIEQMDATTLVLPGQSARVDEGGNILLEFEG